MRFSDDGSVMKVHFLGTTGYHPNDRRQTACLMIPELGIVFDAGTAMFRVRERLETTTLDIFLTHSHLDHVIGLTYLFDVLAPRAGSRTPTTQVIVHGEGDKLKAIERHLFAPALFPIKPPCDFRPLTGRSRELRGGAVVRWFPLDHPGGCLGFRLDYGDRSLAYVTDTTASPTAEYVSAIRDVDLLIHECYFPDGYEDRAALTGHSCATPVAEVASLAGARRLVLVHLDPMESAERLIDLDAMRAIFPETVLAEDGMVVEV